MARFPGRSLTMHMIAAASKTCAPPMWGMHTLREPIPVVMIFIMGGRGESDRGVVSGLGRESRETNFLSYTTNTVSTHGGNAIARAIHVGKEGARVNQEVIEYGHGDPKVDALRAYLRQFSFIPPAKPPEVDATRLALPENYPLMPIYPSHASLHLQ